MWSGPWSKTLMEKLWRDDILPVSFWAIGWDSKHITQIVQMCEDFKIRFYKPYSLKVH